MYAIPTERFAHCIAASKRVRWDIENDVIRGRQFDLAKKFLPDGLTLVDTLPFLVPHEARYFSQVQGRTYANMFGLIERYISAKVLELSRDHWLGDQTALEGLVRFADEELKHQALFRRVEAMIAEAMPPGYRFCADPDQVALAVLAKGDWAVLALTLQIELLTQSHYVASIRSAFDLSELCRDIFLHHWKEECQHAVMDQLEWRRIDAATSAEARDAAVDELVDLIGAVNAIVTGQAEADARYFIATCGRRLDAAQAEAVQQTMIDAYRFQYIVSGAKHPHFAATIARLTTDEQLLRFQRAAGFPVPQPALRAA